jgi:hypothetical protein
MNISNVNEYNLKFNLNSNINNNNNSTKKLENSGFVEDFEEEK